MSSIEERVKKIVVEQLGVKEEEKKQKMAEKAAAKQAKEEAAATAEPGDGDKPAPAAKPKRSPEEIKAQREAMLNDIPLKRLGEATDIAAAVSFLASPAAAYITGQTIHVNGGMYMS